MPTEIKSDFPLDEPTTIEALNQWLYSLVHDRGAEKDTTVVGIRKREGHILLRAEWEDAT